MILNGFEEKKAVMLETKMKWQLQTIKINYFVHCLIFVSNFGLPINLPDDKNDIA